MNGRAALIGTGAGIALGLAMVWSCTVNRATDALACTMNAQCSAGRFCSMGYCIVGSPMDAGPDAPIDAAICPTQCDSCMFNSKTCIITGTGSGGITCPTGWNCTITCAATGACGDIGCTMAQSCDVTCGSDGACGNINCDTANCTAHCTGSGAAGTACGKITCTSGSCDATCTGSNACGDISCTSGHCSESCTGGSAACGNLTCGTGRCDAICNGSAACGAISCPQSCRCTVDCPTGDCGTNTCPMTPQGKYCTQNGSNGLPCNPNFAAQCRKC